MTLATNWWVERCLHFKCLVDPSKEVLCQPIDPEPVDGFGNLTINSTAFIGIDLLHLTRAVALMGAKYDEYLTPKTSVLICNTRRPNPEKLTFTAARRIPAVHVTWLWECLRARKLLPFDENLLNDIEPEALKPRPKPQQPTPTVPISEEDSAKLRKQKAQVGKPTLKPQKQSGVQRSLPLDLASSSDATLASTATTATNRNTASRLPFLDDDEDQNDGSVPNMDGSTSFPLQEIPPGVNSPRRPSTSSTFSTSSNSKSTTETTSLVRPNSKIPKSAAAPKGPTPDSIIPPLTEPVAEEKDYSKIMSNILAQRKAVAEQNLTKKGERQKRRRQLGRATSNPSTAGDAASRTSSGAVAPNPVADEDTSVPKEQDKAHEYQPSQELGWDAPGAQEARENMIRGLGGKVEVTCGVVETIGVLKDIVSGDSGLGRSARRRRG
jgi:hypothetical protein